MLAITHAETAGKRNSLAVLDQFSESVGTSGIAPSVVRISVTGLVAQEGDTAGRTGTVQGKQQRVGCGVIIDPDGYILTNAHMLADAQRICVART
jgi:S1-C subfamily serine protease